MNKLRKYMAKHQIVHIFKEPHHFFIMYLLIPIYIIDYQFNSDYYNNILRGRKE